MIGESGTTDRTASSVSLQWLKGLVVIMSCVYVLMYLYVALSRMGYRYELEWTESGLADEVAAVTQSCMPYREPSVRFVPFLYTPIYFYVSALVSVVTGPGFFPLRLVSFLASLGCFWIIFRMVKRRTGTLFPAIVSVGLFAATYRATGAWLDIGRVDSLFLLFLLLFIDYCDPVTGGLRRNPCAPLLAALLAAIAYFTKQTAVVICLPVLAFFVLMDWKRGLLALGATVGLIVIPHYLLDFLSDGWYGYYTVRLLQQQTEWLKSVFVSFWQHDLAQTLPTVCFLGALPLLSPHARQRDRGYFIFVLLGTLAGSFLLRAKIGGYENVLLPLYAVVAILSGIGLGLIADENEKPSMGERWALQSAICIAVLVQFLVLKYNPLEQIPSRADELAADAYVGELQKIPGQVYIPNHGYLAARAGKASFAHGSAVWDVMRGNVDTRGRKVLERKLAESISRKEFSLIILDQPEWVYLPDVSRYYEFAATNLEKMSPFWPVTGLRTAPSYVFAPKP
jgi:4-amino-4-deoxy-L-arabinose transferase-like glycosyltransferase